MSDGSVGSPFEEAPLDLEISVMKQHHPEIPEEHLEVSADSDECSLEPRFVSVPQDVAVNCGEALTCSCKLNGAKPIGKLKTNECLQHNLTFLYIFHFLLLFITVCYKLDS